MEPLDYLTALWRSRFIIVLLAVLGVGGGLLAGAVVTPTYQAKSSVLLAPSPVVENSELGQVSNFMNSQIHSYAELASSRVVLDPVVTEVGLRYGADRLADQVSAEVPINTQVIDIRVVDTDAARAAALANSIAGHLRTAVQDVAPQANSKVPAVELRTVAAAPTPQHTIAPRKKLYVAVGAGLGLFLGLVVAVARFGLALSRPEMERGLSDRGDEHAYAPQDPEGASGRREMQRVQS